MDRGNKSRNSPQSPAAVDVESNVRLILSPLTVVNTVRGRVAFNLLSGYLYQHTLVKVTARFQSLALHRIDEAGRCWICC